MDKAGLRGQQCALLGPVWDTRERMLEALASEQRTGQQKRRAMAAQLRVTLTHPGPEVL